MPLGFDAPRPNTQSSTICAMGNMSASPASPVRVFSSSSHSRWVSIGAYSITLAPPPLPRNSPSTLPLVKLIGM
ncbi:hypothetical protein D9M73_271510 [compost metagenome]